MALIPTTFRRRLPKGLSYPIGAEAISAALAPVPHYAALRLCFEKRYVDNVLVVLIGNATPGTIVVYAVPSTSSSAVREQLLKEGLLRVAKWLVAERVDTWRLRPHQLVVGYDPAGPLHYAEFTG
ncbi:MAG TPA: hypothetical protein VII38_10175 [Polyangia bacterium]